jgi:hypothetical protein
MPQKNLTKEQIVAALRRLAELAAAESVVLEMTIYGGAAMMLAYDAREATKDVDAIVRPTEVAERLARKVASEMRLHEEWLNNDVRQFVAHREAKNPLLLRELELPSLKITKPTANYLLAMKVMACRRPLPGYAGDVNDIEFLLHKMEIRSIEAIQRIVDRFFPDAPLSESTRATLQTLLKKEGIHESDSKSTHYSAEDGQSRQSESPYDRGFRP